jgi:NAD(P)-dependent dehydrogenase (short-subunit alcohol dehydrogenase family)
MKQTTTNKAGSAVKPRFDRRAVLTGAASAGVAALAAGTVNAQESASQNEFAGKTAFITGGARGIGRACAESLAAAGANIVLYDIASQISDVPYPLATAKDLAESRSMVEKHGVRCLAIKGDVRDYNSQKAAMDKAVTEFGSLDFVIGNAGITQVGALEEFSEEELSLVLDINLKGVIKSVQAATPIFRANGSGRIVLISSVTGRRGSARFPVYSASKWGVIGLAKSTALALGPSGITCNAVCPTLVKTKLLDNNYILSNIVPGQTLTFEQFNEGAKGQHILPDTGLYEPSHIGDLVRFLCSEDSALISGDVFDVGAGANAQYPA